MENARPTPQHDMTRAFYSEECSLIIAIYICISFELITLAFQGG
jgi:hypothetical protein